LNARTPSAASLLLRTPDCIHLFRPIERDDCYRAALFNETTLMTLSDPEYQRRSTAGREQ